MGRVRMPPSGVAAPGQTTVDTVTLWTGGNCEIEMLSNGQQRRWLRTSGMVDLLPAGTIIERVRWNGDATNCIWANVDGALTPSHRGLAGERLGIKDPHVVDLIQRLERQAHEVAPFGRAYVEGLALTLTSYLQSQFSDQPVRNRREAPTGSLTRVQCEALRAYIDDHVERNVTVAELASTCGYSANHFARLFKHSFKKSPHQYLIERRIERAKRLLFDRSKPIAEVAVECGFATQAHLNGSFKRKLGLTPGEFRWSC